MKEIVRDMKEMVHDMLKVLMGVGSYQIFEALEELHDLVVEALEVLGVLLHFEHLPEVPLLIEALHQLFDVTQELLERRDFLPKLLLGIVGQRCESG